MVALLGGLLRHLQGLLHRRGCRSAAEALNELPDLALWEGADEAIHRPTVLERVHRRDRLDAHLLSDLRVLVDVDLDHPNGAVGRTHCLLELRSELFAGPAPGGPEIDDDWRVERAVDDL